MAEIVNPVVDGLSSTTPPSSTYALSGNAYDISVAGLPFFMVSTQQYPYKRETAEFRRTQIDQTREPGEQTLTGWWLRSQSSFHFGAGVKYQEPVQGANVGYQFYKSAGVDPWQVGKVTLLRSTSKVYTPAATPLIVGGRDANGVDVVLAADGANLRRFIGDGTYTTLTWGGTGNILDVAQDGINYYVANSTGIYMGPLTGATNGVAIFTHPVTATSVAMDWVKQRLVAGINNSIFEVVPIGSALTVTGSLINGGVATLTTATAHNIEVGNTITVAGVGTGYNGTWLVDGTSANTVSFATTGANTAFASSTGTVILSSNNNRPIYSHPNSTWVWTGVAEGPNAIYMSGYCGTSSSVMRINIDTSGEIPQLSKATTAATLPGGEYITALTTYVGKYILFGTNRGIRVGTIDTSGYYSSGYITYGPLSVITNGYDPVYERTVTGAAVTGFAFYDRFIFATVSNYIDNGDGTLSSGLVRIDLSRELAPNQLAFCTDLRTMSTATATGVAELGTSGRKFIAATDGIYMESTGALAASGYIQTGQIRYLTLEDKHFKLIKPRAVRPMSGSFEVSTVLADGTVNDVILISQAIDPTADVTTQLSTPLESVGFRFTLYPDTVVTTASPILTGYQLKALPAVKRARQLTIPLMNFDFEEDRFNVVTGYEYRAWDRIAALEAVEANGDTVTIKDFTSGETVSAVIDSVQFVRTTPPERRFKGFGGILYVSARTV